MADPLIGYAVRMQVRQILASYEAEIIDRYFELGGFLPNRDYEDRTAKNEQAALVEKYYHNIDFTDNSSLDRFLLVLGEILYDLNPSRCKYSWQHPSDLAEQHFDRLLRFLTLDGIQYLDERLFVNRDTIDLPDFSELTDVKIETIRSYIDEARKRLAAGNYPAVLTLAYTLIEEFLKVLLRGLSVEFKQSSGNIVHLYGALKDPLNLHPNGDNIERHTRTILEGLSKQIAAIYGLANKGGDRHARVFEPEKHHAQLALNASILLCDYLMSMWEKHNSTDDNSD